MELCGQHDTFPQILSASQPPANTGFLFLHDAYEDGVLSFLMHVSMEGQWFTVEMEADVDGDEMAGEAYVPEMGAGMPFTAKRHDN